MYRRVSAPKINEETGDNNEKSEVKKIKSFNKVTFSRPIMSNRVIAERLEKDRIETMKETVSKPSRLFVILKHLRILEGDN